MVENDPRSQPVASVLFAKPVSYAILKVIKDIKWITPNRISMLSLLFRIMSAYFIVTFTVWPAVVTAYISHILDWLDGLVARETNQKTKLGAALDPTIDRFGATIQLSALFYILLILGSYFSALLVFIILVLFLNELGLWELHAQLKKKEKAVSGLPMEPQGIIGKMMSISRKYKVNTIPSYIDAYYVLFIIGPFFAYNWFIIALGFLFFIPQFMYSLFKLYLVVKE